MVVKILNVLGWLVWCYSLEVCAELAYSAIFEPNDLYEYISLIGPLVFALYLNCVIFFTTRKNRGLFLWSIFPIILSVVLFGRNAVCAPAIYRGFDAAYAAYGMTLVEILILNIIVLIYLSFRKV